MKQIYIKRIKFNENFNCYLLSEKIQVKFSFLNYFLRDFFESIILLLRLVFESSDLEFKLKLESELNIIVVFELVFFISINVSSFLISLINEFYVE